MIDLFSDLSGRFCPVGSLKGIVRTGLLQPGDDFFQKEKQYFDTRTKFLEKTCRELGGIPKGRGDVAYQLPVFSFLPAIFQFWKSDDEFEAEIQFLWDENILQYMHYETIWLIMSHIVRVMKENCRWHS